MWKTQRTVQINRLQHFGRPLQPVVLQIIPEWIEVGNRLQWVHLDLLLETGGVLSQWHQECLQTAGQKQWQGDSSAEDHEDVRKARSGRRGGQWVDSVVGGV